MVKQDFIDGLKLYVTYKMNIDPFLWRNSGTHGAKFRRNVWFALDSLGFPSVAIRRILGISYNYSMKELVVAQYNGVIYLELKRVIEEFADAFTDAEMHSITAENGAISTKTPPHLLNHFRVSDLNNIVVPPYSIWCDHPWVNQFLVNPLGYLKGEWSESTAPPDTGIPLAYPTERMVQYLSDNSGVTVTSGTIISARRVYPDGREGILSVPSDPLPTSNGRDILHQEPSIPGTF